MLRVGRVAVELPEQLVLPRVRGEALVDEKLVRGLGSNPMQRLGGGSGAVLLLRRSCGASQISCSSLVRVTASAVFFLSNSRIMLATATWRERRAASDARAPEGGGAADLGCEKPACSCRLSPRCSCCSQGRLRSPACSS